MIGIISTEFGEGSGAEVVLEHLLRGWSQSALPIILLTPPRSRVGRVAAELSLPVVPLYDKFVFRYWARCGRKQFLPVSFWLQH